MQSWHLSTLNWIWLRFLCHFSKISYHGCIILTENPTNNRNFATGTHLRKKFHMYTCIPLYRYIGEKIQRRVPVNIPNPSISVRKNKRFQSACHVCYNSYVGYLRSRVRLSNLITWFVIECLIYLPM